VHVLVTGRDEPCRLSGFRPVSRGWEESHPLSLGASLLDHIAEDVVAPVTVQDDQGSIPPRLGIRTRSRVSFTTAS
jgi:hypothetical protein